MKLTVTNSSTDFFVPIVHAHRIKLDRITCSNKPEPKALQLLEYNSTSQKLVPVAFRRPGGYRGAAAPVPIPNTAVKRPSANGTPS